MCAHLPVRGDLAYAPSIVVRNAGLELRDSMLWDVFDASNSPDLVARTVGSDSYVSDVRRSTCLACSLVLWKHVCMLLLAASVPALLAPWCCGNMCVCYCSLPQLRQDLGLTLDWEPLIAAAILDQVRSLQLAVHTTGSAPNEVDAAATGLREYPIVALDRSEPRPST